MFIHYMYRYQQNNLTPWPLGVAMHNVLTNFYTKGQYFIWIFFETLSNQTLQQTVQKRCLKRPLKEYVNEKYLKIGISDIYLQLT